MRYSHVLGAAIVGLAAATAVQAGMTASLVAVPIDPVKQATDAALEVNRSRVFDLVVTVDGTEKWASGDLQVALTAGGASGAFYNPATGSDVYQASPTPAAVEYDTYVKSAISANTPSILGKAQYPVESGIGAHVMGPTSVDVAWGDTGSGAGAQTSGSVARLSIVGTKGMAVSGRVGATNNTVAPQTFNGTGDFAVPLFGDIDGDGQINFQDINPFVALFTSAPTTQQLWAGDFTWDGVINFQDINGFVAALTSGGPVPADAMAPLGALVPEPASASLLAAAVIGLVARRRRS